MGEDAIFFITIALALAYAYSNGINDAANAIATVISTRAMSPMVAVAMGASLNLVGALTGTAVAKTIGKGIVDPSIINEYTPSQERSTGLVGGLKWRLRLLADASFHP